MEAEFKTVASRGSVRESSRSRELKGPEAQEEKALVTRGERSRQSGMGV